MDSGGFGLQMVVVEHVADGANHLVTDGEGMHIADAQGKVLRRLQEHPVQPPPPKRLYKLTETDMKHLLQCGSTSPFIAPPPPSDALAGDIIVHRVKDAKGELKLTVVYRRRASASAASKLAYAATCTLASLRESGATGDWRVDEKTGNPYMPSGIGGGTTGALSSAQQGNKGSQEYAFPPLQGEKMVRGTPGTRVPYLRVQAQGNDPRRKRCHEWYQLYTAPLLGHLASMLKQVVPVDFDAMLAAVGETMTPALTGIGAGAGEQVLGRAVPAAAGMGGVFVWPPIEQQTGGNPSGTFMPISQWGVRSAGGHPSLAATKAAATMAAEPCGLHSDTSDSAAGIIVYFGHGGGGDWDEDAGAALPAQDLVVFNGKTGGRLLARIRTYDPNWIVCVIMSFSMLMHANVFPDSAVYEPNRKVQMVRLVGYTPQAVSTIVGKLAALSPEARAEAWLDILKTKLCRGLRKQLGLKPDYRNNNVVY